MWNQLSLFEVELTHSRRMDKECMHKKDAGLLTSEGWEA